MAAHGVQLAVLSHTPEEFVKVVEILSRTVTGLALDGYTANLTVEPVECETCDEEEEEESEDPEDPEAPGTSSIPPP